MKVRKGGYVLLVILHCLADTGFTFVKIAVSEQSEAEPRYSYLREGKSCICQKQMPDDRFYPTTFHHDPL